MDGYDDYYKSHSSPEFHNWLFMQGPLPIICILTAYLVFVYKVGPAFMANREPYKLQVVLIGYNLFAAVYSLGIIVMYFVSGGFNYLYTKGLCRSDSMTEDLAHSLSSIFWWFLIAKIMELADTVFFVLRKKQQQVTFLHVYHHTIMTLAVWYISKYHPCEQALINGQLNSLVHVFMYLYYMLAAMGPRYEKYLWWRKYLTVLQLVQFSLLIIYSSYLLLFDCRHPKSVSIFFLFFHTLFWYMFASFYYKAYIKKPKYNKFT
ncbi:very long chain fatty acid elongase 7-like [Periplaneta americana]|uniref:very long chain fatty acid elongase 7-like n=1 Tax=Periplaneta americana TaxID=6978 RepID=UPI0037E96609